MSNNSVEKEPVRDFYEELADCSSHDDAGSRLRASSMIMEKCGDKEMSEVLGVLAAQMDFDDNEEASAAIERTRMKLDAMIASRQARGAMNYVKRLMDDEILEISNGEVVESDYDYLDSKFYTKGLFDPDIFGGSGRIPLYDKEGDRIPTKSFGIGLGHIMLPAHCIIESDYQMIANLLGMSADGVHKVAKSCAYLVMEPGKSSLVRFTVLSEKEYNEHYGEEGFVAKTGGDAIYEALLSLGYPDHPERLAIQVIPVISPILRPVAYDKDDDVYCSYPLNDAYRAVVNAVRRTNRLAAIGVPDVILRNEMRMLDDTVNRLIEDVRACVNNTHWNGSKFHNFLYAHLRLVLRNRHFGMKRLTEQELGKTEDIVSLGVFPETVLFRNANGDMEDIRLRDVIGHNDEFVEDYRREHAVVLPEDADMDNLDASTKAQMQEWERTLKYLEACTSEILDDARKCKGTFDAAKTYKGTCIVVFDEKMGMYTLLN